MWNSSKLAANTSIFEFVILKAFSVQMTYRSAHRIKEVTWQTPFFNWVKCNIDGASNGNPGPSSCGGTFKNNDADFLGAFALNMGISTSLCAELHSAIIAIEIAFNRG